MKRVVLVTATLVTLASLALPAHAQTVPDSAPDVEADLTAKLVTPELCMAQGGIYDAASDTCKSV